MRWIPVSVEDPTLRLESLDVTFETPQGEVRAVRDLSLSVAPGECLGVVGESGAGKSQSFLAVMGLLGRNARVSGRALFAGVDLLTLSRAGLDRIRGSRIGMVFQDPMTSLTPHVRVGDQIAEPIAHHRGASRAAALQRALELLRQVHVTDPERRLRQYPHELSGGMRQRVMLAIALACEPSLLIADEPTTALDVTIQAQILSLLVELKQAQRMAMILITHDMGAVAGVADRVAIMNQGRLLEIGSTGAVFKSPQQQYTRSLLASVARIDAREPVPAEGARTAASALALTDIRVEFPITTGWLAAPRVLRAVEGVSLQVAAGEALGIVGESGSGKSTLARTALRLLPPDSGQIVWLGRRVDDLSARELKPLRRDVQVIFQDPLASLDPRMTVSQIVAEPLQVHRPALGAPERQAEVIEALTQVRLDPALAHRYPHELSGGQCQRVGLARAMILRPRVLICDEPVSALDVTVQEEIVALLADLKRRSGLAMVLISHNLAVVRQLCERILVLYLGKMMEQGCAASVYSEPLHPYTRELLACVPIPDPEVQPGRLARALPGEPPSPLAPPSGCVYRTRCPHAIDVCREREPQWEPTRGRSGAVACHRWRDPGVAP